ncbi:MAG: hypothetical protein QGF46_07395, partial [Planctomycetota bacterium]|nr:hypothetical protein [Planctomycetota bacterium]
MSKDLLEIPKLLAWVSEFATTRVGAEAISGLDFDDSVAAEQRRQTGAEAKQAVEAQQAPSLARCIDLRELLFDCEQRALSGGELVDACETFERNTQLQSWARNHPIYTAFGKLIAGVPETENLARLIRKSIDTRGNVRDEADLELPKLRSELEKLNRQRNQKFDLIAESLHAKGVLQQRHPVQRMGKLMLAVKASHAGRAGGAVHERSQSGDTIFVEPTAIIEISNRVVNVEFQIKRIEEEILRELSLAILRRSDDLLLLNKIISEIDLALASSNWAIKVGAEYPQMVNREQGVTLHQARHPLLVRQLGAQEVVPLDLSLGNNYDLLVVTGPNTGGKTLVLKTVGVAVW